jgi:methyl-accepting chemotaxis protein
MRWGTVDVVRAVIDRVRGLGRRPLVPDGGRPEEVTVSETPTPETDLNIDDDVLIDGMGTPVFVLDTGGEVVAWNESVERLTGNGDDVAIGCDRVSTVFYPDARERPMLAEKVLDAPEAADQRYDATLEDEELSLYAERETVTDRFGETRHFRHTAMPLYEEGEFVAVIQVVHDRTDEVRRQEAVADLVEEVKGTLDALVEGRLDTRATFDAADVVDDQLVDVVSALNDMAEEFERLAAQVDTETQSLAAAVDRTADAAEDIATNVEKQHTLFEDVTDEMQSFSAGVEEVAATADDVETAATRARESATDGLEASTDAREATDRVVEVGDELVENVSELGDRMDDVESVVEVVSEVADQTNLLALNANIEAARAGRDGDGFAVVAEEVKTLAEETQAHTDDITASIEEMQAQTEATVTAATESHDRIVQASDRITAVLATLEDIAADIDEAADGIAEVSRATDDQASTVEELTATIEHARDRADETAEAADRIVDAAEESTAAIDELVDSVNRLRAGDGDAGGPSL